MNKSGPCFPEDDTVVKSLNQGGLLALGRDNTIAVVLDTILDTTEVLDTWEF